MVTIRISDLVKTCESCPAQWSGKSTDGREVYIRFRWGYLSICIAEAGGNPVRGEEVFGKQLSDGLDGSLTETQLQEAVSGEVEIV